MPSLVATSSPCSLAEASMFSARPAPYLLVVQDRRVRAAVLRHHGGQSGALDGVLGHDPQVVARAGRVVLVGLALLGAGLAGGQAHGGVRRADLGDRHLVQDRDRDRARARVELADVGDRVLVLRHLRALAEAASGVQLPAWAVESSSEVYFTVVWPALPPACSSASLIPFTIARVWSRCALERQRRVHVDRAGAALAGVVAIVVVVSAGRQAREQDQAEVRPASMVRRFIRSPISIRSERVQRAAPQASRIPAGTDRNGRLTDSSSPPRSRG